LNGGGDLVVRVKVRDRGRRVEGSCRILDSAGDEDDFVASVSREEEKFP